MITFRGFGSWTFFLAAALALVPNGRMAAAEQTDADRWLAKAQVAPAFSVPSSLEAWQAKRKEVRAQLWELLGKLPPRPKVPKVQTLSREDRGDYVLEKFQFDNEAGATVPGYLLLPKNATGKSPCILYCHWHGGEYDIGKEQMFGLKHSPEPIGPAFAKRGFVVIAVDAYCFGERNGRGPDGGGEKGTEGEWTAGKFNLWLGRSLWGMILRDDLMALDYAVSRPEVDSTQIGVTGMSMGATRSWWLMALDERIKTGVAVACLTRYQNLIQHGMLKAHGIYYFVPGMLNHFDSEAVVALIAPRSALFMNGGVDDGSPEDGIHAIEAVVRPAYRLYGKEGEFVSIIYPGEGHVYTLDMWNKTLEWMDAKLKNGGAKK